MKVINSLLIWLIESPLLLFAFTNINQVSPYDTETWSTRNSNNYCQTLLNSAATSLHTNCQNFPPTSQTGIISSMCNQDCSAIAYKFANRLRKSNCADDLSAVNENVVTCGFIKDFASVGSTTTSSSNSLLYNLNSGYNSFSAGGLQCTCLQAVEQILSSWNYWGHSYNYWNLRSAFCGDCSDFSYSFFHNLVADQVEPFLTSTTTIHHHFRSDEKQVAKSILNSVKGLSCSSDDNIETNTFSHYHHYYNNNNEDDEYYPITSQETTIPHNNQHHQEWTQQQQHNDDNWDYPSTTSWLTPDHINIEDERVVLIDHVNPEDDRIIHTTTTNSDDPIMITTTTILPTINPTTVVVTTNNPTNTLINDELVFDEPLPTTTTTTTTTTTVVTNSFDDEVVVVDTFDPVTSTTTTISTPQETDVVITENLIEDEVVVVDDPATEEIVVVGDPASEEVVVVGDPATEDVVITDNLIEDEVIVVGDPATEDVVVVGDPVTESDNDVVVVVDDSTF